MASFNKVMLMGNLTRDPEVRFTPKGSAVCDIGLAVNRTWTDDSGKKQEEVTFVDVTFWGKLGEILGKYGHKGKPLFIEGRLSLDSWEDKQTGQKRTRLKIVGESLQLLGSKPEGDQSSPTQQPRQQQRRQQAPTPRQIAEGEGYNPADGMEDDDIPF